MFALTLTRNNERLSNSSTIPCFRPLLSDPGNFLSPVIVVLGAHTKQFKDSNFNVLKASFLGISSLLEAAYAAGGAKGNRAALSMVVAPAVEKLGDRKLQVKKEEGIGRGCSSHHMKALCFMPVFCRPFTVSTQVNYSETGPDVS